MRRALILLVTVLVLMSLWRWFSGDPARRGGDVAKASELGVTGQAFDLAHLSRQAAGGPYQEFLRVASMSAGIYRLPAGATDGQRPHDEDEMYYVVRGRSKFVVDGSETQVGPGSILFVAAGAEHRFFEITEDLELLVFFAPQESP
jgi:mannose-6-phosphate isomerase-like protein (cupin superfamily)